MHDERQITGAGCSRRQRNEAESAAFSDSAMLSVMLLEPEIELEPPVPTGFESFWK